MIVLTSFFKSVFFSFPHLFFFFFRFVCLFFIFEFQLNNEQHGSRLKLSPSVSLVKSDPVACCFYKEKPRDFLCCSRFHPKEKN